MPRTYKRHCNECAKYYEGQGEKYCSGACKGKNIVKAENYILYQKRRKENKRPRKEITLNYYYRNLEKSRKYFQETTKKRTSYIYRGLVRNSKKKNRLMGLSFTEFLGWYSSAIKECFYCGVSEETWVNLHSRHKVKRLSIDRKDNDDWYSLENSCLACDTCNKMKSNVLAANEMIEIGQKYIKPKWQAEFATHTTKKR